MLENDTVTELTAAEIREIRMRYPGENGRPLSYRKFAHVLGVSWQSIQSWELGVRKPGALAVRVLSALRAKHCAPLPRN